MKSALLFGALAIAIAASLYFTYTRSFVTHDFEITYSEEGEGEEVEVMEPEDTVSPDEGEAVSTTTEEEESDSVMNSE